MTGKKGLGGKAECIEKEKEKEYRDKLKVSPSEIRKRARSVKFVNAAQKLIDIKTEKREWAPKTQVMHSLSLNKHLRPFFGDCLLEQVTAEKISDYQVNRLKEIKASNKDKEVEGETPAYHRTINIEVSLIRMVLVANKMWVNIGPDVKMLKENKEIGRELTEKEQKYLLEAAKKSDSRSLYPAILLSIHTGLRNEESRKLQWKRVNFDEGTITVGKSKTDAGKGRIVLLSEMAWQVLKDWHSKFPDAKPEHYVFPSEKYALKGKEGMYGGEVVPYQVNPEKPMGSWKRSWTTAKREAGKAIAKADGGEAVDASPIDCRWHDLRHSAASKIAAGGATDQTLQALLGWMSPEMIKRYSHVRAEAMRRAVTVFNTAATVQ